MSRIFLSHSSDDNFEAIALRDWLAVEGWDDVFLDLDPVRGIVAGERWERRLHEAANRCEAVVFLVSRAWLASGWCLKEYNLARGLNKKLFAVLVEPGLRVDDLPPELSGTWQAVDLAGGRDLQLFRTERPDSHEEKHVGFSREGLQRFRQGLRKAGLDARFYAWPPEGEPNRAPYRGLKSLEAHDAGIFFGRDAPIVEAIDRLRGLRAGAAPRILVILGASGAGKSSFLRAGLLPRLARDDAHFMPLPPIRPERAAINGESGLLAALEKACPARTRAELRAAIKGGAGQVRPILAELVQAPFDAATDGSARGAPPAIVLAIDQAEELFRTEGATEGAALLELVRDLTSADDPALIAIFAIRSDAYDALEHAKPLEGLAQAALPLLPMPRGAYKEVIEGPAQRFAHAGGKLEIEPRLTLRLLEEIEAGAGSDALPLLAFALEQLYLEYHRAGVLRLADYETMGGFKGAIDAAIERAFLRADADSRIPRDRAAREALLRRGLIPWLAGIDPDTKTPRRNIARRADIPAEAAPLIDLLVEERLLSTDVSVERDPATGFDVQVGTVEPTHEALLRQWGLLDGWLSEDLGLLAALEGVKRAARDWDANGRGEAWLAHQGQRLAESLALDARPDIAARWDGLDRAYLAGCRAREDAARAEAEQRRLEREAEQERRLVDARTLAAANRRIARRTGIGLVAALVLAVAAAVVGIVALKEKSAADMSSRESQAQRVLADAAAKESRRQAKLSKQQTARLASYFALDLLDNGAIDPALLLLLDGATQFDDADAPDILKIALYKALDKSFDAKTFSFHRPTLVLVTKRFLFFVDMATQDIHYFTDSIEPHLMMKGRPGDKTVAGIIEAQDGKSVYIRRADESIEAFDLTGRSLHPPVRFEAKPEEYHETKVYPDGLAIKESFGNERAGRLLQVIDVRTGHKALHRLTDKQFDFSHSPSVAGDRLIALHPYTTEKAPRDIYRIDEGANGLTLQKIDRSKDVEDKVFYGDCIAFDDPATRARVVESLKKNDFNTNELQSCTRTKAGVVVTRIRPTSGGQVRFDGLVKTDGSLLDFAEAANNRRQTRIGEDSVAWAGFDGASNTFALIAHQDVVVGDETAIQLDERHPTTPIAARLLDRNRLLVAEPSTGTIVMHTFGTASRRLTATSLYRSRGDAIVKANTPIVPLHYAPTGNSGWTLAPVAMADGTELRYDAEKHVLKVKTRAAAFDMPLPRDARYSFSSDFRKMISIGYGPVGIQIFDFAKALATRKLEGTNLPSPPLRAVAGAFFTGTDDEIVVADYSNEVNVWRPESGSWTRRTLYRGDYPVVHAEPDKQMKRLLIMENRGTSYIQGWLYSIEARRKWLDLDSEYKWLTISYDRNEDIFVTKNPGYKAYTIRELSELVSYAKAAISPSCGVRNDAYRASPCWPSTVN